VKSASLADGRLRACLRHLLAGLYLVAGIGHLAFPSIFMLIVPGWVPAPAVVVLVTGACEILGAIGLLTRRWRRAAGYLLAIYAICVFPANVKHAFEGVQIPHIPNSWYYHGPRLLLQPVLVWLPLFCASIIDWPLRRRR
jgi:uncharacterized membrane protein